MNSRFHMIDVGEKKVTHRIAIAQGRILVGERAFELIRTRSLPKGDALILAEIAGIQGAKQASHTIPLCHPMGLDHVEIKTVLNEASCAIEVRCIASTHAKTGVEMEALAGVNAALLTLWDLTKMIEPDLCIEDVRLMAKRGGKSGLWLNPIGVDDWVLQKIAAKNTNSLQGITAAIIVLSDRAAAGQYEDSSGPLARTLLESAGATVIEITVIPDEPILLREKILTIQHRADARLILTLGGTGIGPRDSTPETVAELADQIIPGIGELLRQYGAQFTPYSWSSRSMGATLGNMLLITLPGSPKAVREGIECLSPQIAHLIHTLDDIKHV